ncbi:hypothetical protein Pyn_21921 [Prunus yedoensis var. nudiflora]|uniref:Uncharacterized protein n=1 Tax=Prunus yedoensis var. nudiflora TaxID=2094558 RepID=A0A314YDJ9_PRUYE|nr:hypothetical protein Pyn_21921 [Prunus yedoensis var. nudiflora]
MAISLSSTTCNHCRRNATQIIHHKRYRQIHKEERERGPNVVVLWRSSTPKDSKAWRRMGLAWNVEMRFGGRTPDRTMPLAMLSAILPAPMNPSLNVYVGMGDASIAKCDVSELDSVCFWQQGP